MTVSVLAAFFGSGGLKAGTPLAIASTPVSATDPPAKAFRSRNKLSVSVAPGTSASGWAIGWTVPVTMWMSPTPTISRARTTKR